MKVRREQNDRGVRKHLWHPKQMQRKPVPPLVRATDYPLWLLSGFWISVGIALAAVVRRLYALTHPSSSGPLQIANPDAVFASHAVLTIAHIIPAAIFVLLAAGVLLRRTDDERLERLFFPFGFITGVTAYLMSAYAVGGWAERSAVLVFNTWFLFSLGRAYRFQLCGETARKRDWITRAVGILLGIATTRPVMGVFFATSSRTHLSPREFFGIAFWIGFSINAALIELWLHSKRRARLYRPRVGSESVPTAQSVHQVDV